nr:unnamed protein product [Callosobruchus chinensis]
MYTRNFFFSSQGGHSSYIKNRMIRSPGSPGPGMDCLVI